MRLLFGSEIKVVEYRQMVEYFTLISDLQNVWEYSYTTVPKIDEDEDDFLSVQSRMGMQQGTGGVIINLKLGYCRLRLWFAYE
jgi:hypothetical protein